MSDKKEFITAHVYLVRKPISELEMDNLGLEEKELVGNNYPIHIRLSSIDVVIPIPDSDGIPLEQYARIAIRGLEYNIEYNYKKLNELLNID